MHWVTHEVLPSIRKHDAYITSAKMEELMNNPDTGVKPHSATGAQRERIAAKQNREKQAESHFLRCGFCL